MLVNHQVVKFVKCTFEHFKLFIIIIINHIMTYWISVIMFLSTRDTYLAIYISVINMSPDFMWEFFSSNLLQYNLQKANIFCLPPARSSWYGINSLAFRGSLLWKSLTSNVQQSYKDFKSLKEFKLEYRKLGNIHCTFVMCRWN